MSVTGFRPAVQAFVVHPHAMARKALTDELSGAGITITGEASDLAGAAQAIRDAVPDVVLVAATLPDGTGAALCASLRADLPVCRVLLVADRDGEHVSDAMAAGAVGCWLVDDPQVPLADAVRGAMRHEGLVTPIWAARLLEAYDALAAADRQVPAPALSDDEYAILTGIAAGAVPGDIATALELTTHVVDLHVGAAVVKLQRAITDEAAARQPAMSANDQ